MQYLQTEKAVAKEGVDTSRGLFGNILYEHGHHASLREGFIHMVPPN